MRCLWTMICCSEQCLQFPGLSSASLLYALIAIFRFTLELPSLLACVRRLFIIGAGCQGWWAIAMSSAYSATILHVMEIFGIGLSIVYIKYICGESFGPCGTSAYCRKDENFVSLFYPEILCIPFSQFFILNHRAIHYMSNELVTSWKITSVTSVLFIPSKAYSTSRSICQSVECYSQNAYCSIGKMSNSSLWCWINLVVINLQFRP